MVEREGGTNAGQVGQSFMHCGLEDMFPDCILHSQATQISDHCPLLLDLMAGSHGKRRFHYESFWTKLPGFHEVVADSWGQNVTASWPYGANFENIKKAHKSTTILEPEASGTYQDSAQFDKGNFVSTGDCTRQSPLECG